MSKAADKWKLDHGVVSKSADGTGMRLDHGEEVMTINGTEVKLGHADGTVMR